MLGTEQELPEFSPPMRTALENLVKAIKNYISNPVIETEERMEDEMETARKVAMEEASVASVATVATVAARKDTIMNIEKIPFISFNNGVYNVKKSIKMNESEMKMKFDSPAKVFVYRYYNYNPATEIASGGDRVTRKPFYYIKHDIDLEQFEYDLWGIIGYYVSDEDLGKLKNPNNPKMLQQQLDEFKKDHVKFKKMLSVLKIIIGKKDIKKITPKMFSPKKIINKEFMYLIKGI